MSKSEFEGAIGIDLGNFMLIYIKVQHIHVLL
jgi:hypothetical protein